MELIGATLVAVALSPIRSYVRLYPDQLKELIDTFDELDGCADARGLNAGRTT